MIFFIHVFIFYFSKLEESDDYEERRRLRARLRQVMAEQEGNIFYY